MEPEKSLQELKKEALLRRADKLLGWLRRPDYTDYTDHESTDRLIKFVNLTIWAFEQSITREEWKPFFEQFKEIKDVANNVEGDEKENYYNAIALLTATLSNYKEYISLPDAIK